MPAPILPIAEPEPEPLPEPEPVPEPEPLPEPEPVPEPLPAPEFPIFAEEVPDPQMPMIAQPVQAPPAPQHDLAAIYDAIRRSEETIRNDISALRLEMIRMIGEVMASSRRGVRVSFNNHLKRHPEPAVIGNLPSGGEILDDDNGPDVGPISPGSAGRIQKLVQEADLTSAPSGEPYAPTTKAQYSAGLQRLYSRLPAELRTKTFFKSTDEVRKAIVAPDLTPSMRASIAAAVYGYINNINLPLATMRPYKQFYSRLLRELKSDGVSPSTLTAKQMARWVPFNILVDKQLRRLGEYHRLLELPENVALKNLMADPKNVTFAHKPPRVDDRMKLATRYALITSLYILLPPLRAEEIILLNVTRPADGNLKVNWIDWERHLLIRNAYKTSGRYGTTEIALPTELYDLFRAQAHVIGNSNEVLIPTPQEKKRYGSQFHLLVESAFDQQGLNVDTIRIVFSTTFGEVYRGNHDLSLEIARIMGHGTEMHEARYIKRNYIDEEGKVVDLPASFYEQNRPSSMPWREALSEAQAVQRRLAEERSS
ncbi:hypothetical protein PAPYR_12522 [Paratrimastix pyriformis]|uniref:Tyr recombinase domain-containing protein n=1 Tax=Paratrimastix pyriformis TaxID=342808 RepID=A0ABQ8U1S3_9EUKA|nr:hypothetical protein PAPYR_12522 [Paratrimastix pyriformis]